MNILFASCLLLFGLLVIIEFRMIKKRIDDLSDNMVVKIIDSLRELGKQRDRINVLENRVNVLESKLR